MRKTENKMKSAGVLAFRIAGALLCCALTAGGIAPAWAGEPAGVATRPPENANGMPLVPDFTLPSASGNQVSLSDFAGKQVVLYFWASWCSNCRDNMPDKQALRDWMIENEFPGEVLAINITDGMQETRETCDAFIKENGYTMPVLYEEVGQLSSLFGITGIPVTVVIDAQGYFKGGAIGAQPLEDTMRLLEQDT